MAKTANLTINLKGVGRKTNRLKQIILEESVKMAEEVGELGELEVKSNIAASGTPFSLKARQAGINKGPGRYRTGLMYNSVSHLVSKSGGNVIARFGFVKRFEDYFRYQELGFRNKFIAAYDGSGNLKVRGGAPVIRRNPFGGFKNTPGMFAIRDARTAIVEELPAIARKYEGIIKRRVRKT